MFVVTERLRTLSPFETVRQALSIRIDLCWRENLFLWKHFLWTVRVRRSNWWALRPMIPKMFLGLLRRKWKSRILSGIFFRWKTCLSNICDQITIIQAKRRFFFLHFYRGETNSKPKSSWITFRLSDRSNLNINNAARSERLTLFQLRRHEKTQNLNNERKFEKKLDDDWQKV